jgi:hypothetical protein
MQDDDIQVPVDLPVSGTSAPDTSEPLAQPDKAAPSTGTEQPAEDAAPAEEQANAEKQPPEEPTEDKPEKKTPWFVERIAKQREELARERQQREELNARLAAFEQQQFKGSKTPTSNSSNECHHRQSCSRWFGQKPRESQKPRHINQS